MDAEEARAYGVVDELSSFLGLVQAKLDFEKEKALITDIQKDLHQMMAILAHFPKIDLKPLEKRVKIFENMSKKPARNWLSGAFRLTGADICYYVNEKRWINDAIIRQTNGLFGQPTSVGEVYIWKINTIVP